MGEINGKYKNPINVNDAPRYHKNRKYLSRSVSLYLSLSLPISLSHLSHPRSRTYPRHFVMPYENEKKFHFLKYKKYYEQIFCL